MTRIGSVAAGTLGFILVWTSLALCAERLSSYNFLQDVSVDRNHGELQILLKFRKPLAHFEGPNFFKKSIQMDFPFTYVNPSKRYFDTGDETVRQVYVSQFDRNRLRLRLILAPGTPNLKNQTVVEQVGRVLRIRIKKIAPVPIRLPKETPDELESLLARASLIQEAQAPKTKTTSSQQAARSAQAKPSPVSVAKGEVIPAAAAKEIKKASPLLSETLGQAWKKDRSKQASPSNPLPLKTKKAGLLDFEEGLSLGQPDLFSASLKMAYTLALVLGFMFIVLHFFKKFGLKNSVFGGEGKPVKVLSTGFLAPRKSIALVEVAGDILVLGIANDQISLLSSIQDPEKIEQIKNSLQKKGGRAKPPAPRREPEAGNTQAKNPGVDVYNKRLVPSGSTNPFGEYVKQFTDSSEAKPVSPKEVAGRVRKKMGEVPVFE